MGEWQTGAEGEVVRIVSKEIPGDIYLIKVNSFNDLVLSALDEWMYFLKNTELPNRFKVKELTQVE